MSPIKVPSSSRALDRPSNRTSKPKLTTLCKFYGGWSKETLGKEARLTGGPFHTTSIIMSVDKFNVFVTSAFLARRAWKKRGFILASRLSVCLPRILPSITHAGFWVTNLPSHDGLVKQEDDIALFGCIYIYIYGLSTATRYGNSIRATVCSRLIGIYCSQNRGEIAKRVAL